MAARRPANSPPQVIEQSEPRYPESLGQNASEGYCMVAVTVDKEGRPHDPVVLGTNHPDFVRPSIRAIMAWRFKPALRDGQPVEGTWRQTISYHVRSGYMPTGDAVFGFSSVNGPGTPPEYRFDSNPRIMFVVKPVYPFELALAGVEGKAEVNFVVPLDGMPEQVKVVSATRPEFGEALRAMAEVCLIQPAGRRGRQVPSLMVRRQTFSSRAENLEFSRETKQLIEKLRAHPGEIATLSELDSKPRPLYQCAPTYPRAFDGTKTSGTAEIEFYIDPKGQAQLPRVVSASRPEFGWSAVTAVQQWVFEEPKRKGQDVYVRVQVPIEFRPVIRLLHLAQ